MKQQAWPMQPQGCLHAGHNDMRQASLSLCVHRQEIVDGGGVLAVG
jgi:hypothetical protein